ncbi:hypothetical protein CWI37_2518p0010, partial [Hamiltosporidium tvaerminnensis]
NNTPNNITNTFITPLDILPVNTSLTVVDLSDNNLSFLPQKFYKIFTGVSSVRLYNNPFIYLHYKIPLKCPSLLQMCYSKCVNKGMVRDFWMNCKFNKNNFCDVCGTVYVSEGVVCYDVGNVGEGGVVIKKEIIGGVSNRGRGRLGGGHSSNYYKGVNYMVCVNKRVLITRVVNKMVLITRVVHNRVLIIRVCVNKRVLIKGFVLIRGC